MGWTKEQLSAIEKKGSNILVAAAAGSGKTAVLVERIIKKIIDDGVDIDKLLVVTFTNAAAVEMRERVLDAIYKKLDEEPDNENLKRQILLLSKANICTIHSFCLEVIKNNFFEIDLSSNFRIASEEEIALFKQEVLEDLFEKKYEEEDEDFIKLVDLYTGYKGDEALKDLVLRVFGYIQSSPYPEKWLHEKVELFNPGNDHDEDFGKSIWGQILLKEFSDKIEEFTNSIKIIYNKVQRLPELENANKTLKSDIESLTFLKDCTKKSWDATFDASMEFSLARWVDDKKVASDLKEQAKKIRTDIKEKVNKTVDDIMLYKSDEAYEDIFAMYEILSRLEKVINEFSVEFLKKKREKNVIDFGDIEHFALKILVKEEDGKLVPTDVAKRYQEKFEEIAIDEYQDSNRVQEEILTKVSKGNNVYMVGDVKQSIYKFRLACPDLFLEKYDKYSLDGNDLGLKIQLFKNFRSRENVLDVTNEIFECIMSRELGEIDYNETEYLNYMAGYDNFENQFEKAELKIINLKDESDDDEDLTPEEKKVKDSFKFIEKDQVEAKYIASKIKEMMDAGYEVQDKKLKDAPIKHRKMMYKDIVILLRSSKNVANVYEKELLSHGIPVYSDASSSYLDTIEIQTMTNLLKIIDNPTEDIPFVSILRSVIAGFTDNELVEMRLIDRNCSFYESMMKYSYSEKNALAEKGRNFLERIKDWKNKSEYMALSELLWEIYVETGFFNYVALMLNGNLRQSNLKMLLERAKDYEKTSFKGLYNFIKFIDKMKIGDKDFSSAKVIGENENVVRIMTIHKSKGLEFPVVFLSNSSKNINLMDLKDTILLHQTIGFGPDYINYERRIKYSTAAKYAIKLKVKEESISEEMRVLYVALTRAREKLIITGCANDYKKELETMKENLAVYEDVDGKINPLLLKKYISYLDWIQLVNLKSEKFRSYIDTEILNKFDILVNDEVIEETEKKEIDFSQFSEFGALEEALNWQYPNEIKTNLPIKSSVSSIKEMMIGNLKNDEIGLANVKPEFLEETTEKLTSREKGTLVHLVLQKIDFSKEYDRKSLSEFIDELLAKKIINQKQRENINEFKIMNFLQSDLVKQIKEAKEVNREKPFCTKISAKDLYGTENDEFILVQGIIDLYFITKNDEVILVDYKTDYVENDENELKEKYEVQLDLYKTALEKALNKKVDKTYIYSIYMGKSIEL